MSWGGAAVAGGSTAGVRRQRGLCPWSSPAAAPHEMQEGCEPLLHLGTGKNKHRTQLQKSAALTAPENLAFSAAQDLFPSGVYAADKVSRVCSEGARSSSGLRERSFLYSGSLTSLLLLCT